jgi:hypothetical protein
MSNLELTKEQIKIAKDKYKEIYWEVVNVQHHDYRLEILLRSKKDGKQECKHIPIGYFKCLQGKSDWDLKGVNVLGERAIQWENLDIQIDLELLLQAIQLEHEWLEDLK